MSGAVLLLCLEWVAALLTIWGAWLLSSGSTRAAWGWAFFLAANALWFAFGWLTAHHGLMLQQVVLSVISVRGIWNGLVRDALDSPMGQFTDGGKP